MSLGLGPIRQLGYVVRDIHASMRYWSGLGVGPFHFFEEAPIGDFRFRDAACHAKFAFALGQSGAAQVELILPLDDTASIYREFLNRQGAGLQHVAFWTREFSVNRERLLQLGFSEVLSGFTGDPEGRFAYFEAGASQASGCIELSALSKRKERLFAGVAQSSLGWDGGHPVRDGKRLIS